ncbi:MAG: septum formation initiator family protein, partial [Endomicrobia bacterium]|nr:septum formation initiator family protein [Endomicrobiia bacterium]
MKRKNSNYEVSLPKINLTKVGILIFCILIAYFFIINNIVKYYILHRNYKILKNRIDNLKTENEKLRHEIF